MRCAYIRSGVPRILTPHSIKNDSSKKSFEYKWKALKCVCLLSEESARIPNPNILLARDTTLGNVVVIIKVNCILASPI